MTTHTFTEAQAAHALEVVLRLMKEHRFFLYQHRLERSADTDPSYTLDPRVFGSAQELDEKIRGAYSEACAKAESIINQAESELGIALPDLSGNKQLVRCNRYTGGLDICRVYPLTAFLQYAPNSLEELISRCFQQLLHGKIEDDLAPKATRQLRDRAKELAKIIWEQLGAMGRGDVDNPRCVVLMQTRFSCDSSGVNRDFMHGRTWNMQGFPQAMGYLFHAYSMENRIVGHNHVVFSTSCDSHVNVQHWRSEKHPTIWYNADGGYSCPVIFVTVL